jgi:hypothetical protein
MILRRYGDYFPKKHKTRGFYDGKDLYFLRGME